MSTRTHPKMKCLAPMVEGSDLPYRLLLGHLTHVWTPMYNCVTLLQNPRLGQEIVRSIAYEKARRPYKVVLQLATNNVEALKKAYALVAENEADFVEINFGCAQQIAKEGRYGSYLLDNVDHCIVLIEALREVAGPSKKISVKTRLFEKLDEFLDRAAVAGASLFTLHGRVKGLKLGCFSGPSDFVAVVKHMNILKERHPGVTFVVNGGIWTYEQHRYFTEQALADGTMAATFLLANPFLYGWEKEKSRFHAGDETRWLTWRSEEEIQRELAKIFALPGRPQILAELEAKRGGAVLQPVQYVYNPLLAQHDPLASLSQDVLLNMIKQANASRPEGVRYILHPRDLRRQILISAVDVVHNWKLCCESEIEAPWGGMLGHVIHSCDRDLMNANVDVRALLTDKLRPGSENYQERRMERILVSIGEFWLRLENGLAHDPEAAK